jgi:hypothetical protein
LGSTANVPDHSTFSSKNRQGRFRESDLLRKLFESVVARCMKEGSSGAKGSVTASGMAALCAKRPKTRVASDRTPAIWSPIQSGMK